MAVFAAKFLHSDLRLCGGREEYFCLVDATVARGLYSGSEGTGINDFRDDAVKSLVQVAVVIAHADEHTHFAQCKGAQPCVVGVVVIAIQMRAPSVFSNVYQVALTLMEAASLMYSLPCMCATCSIR